MFFNAILRISRRAHGGLRDERGFLSIMAISILSAMMLAGLAMLALNQRNNTELRNDRSTQTAYSIAEESLNDQLQALTRGWPSSPGSAMPVVCTHANTNSACPDAGTVARSFATTLAAQNIVEWQVMVRDNVGVLRDDFQLANMNLGTVSGCAAPCTWDAGGDPDTGGPDSTMWVVAQAYIKDAGCAARGGTGPTGNLSSCVRKRTLLAQAKLVESTIELPRSVVTAGSFQTTNRGNKTIVDENGCWNVPGVCPPGGLSGGSPAPIQVRCDSTSPGTPNDPCLGYDTDKGQISPNLATDRYPSGQLISPDELEMLRSSARSAGTYFNACPNSIAGKVVFIELTTFGSCSFRDETANTEAQPGAVIMVNGKIELSANMVYNGLIYAANNHAPYDDPDVVTLNGNCVLQGAIFVEGDGGVMIGQSSGRQPTINFNEAALNSFKGVTGVGIGQNTFRDLPTTS